ncbi:hypothetical protein ACFE04_029690 [Oxalis oulophora]
MDCLLYSDRVLTGLEFRCKVNIGIIEDEEKLRFVIVVEHEQVMGSQGPSWADQWGSVDQDDDNYNRTSKKSESGSGNKKIAEVKAAASAGFDKAKSATTVGAQKVKTGTSVGFKWVKNQCNKLSSK